MVALADLDIIGLYVPSRDESTDKLERKRRFCAAISAFLADRPRRDAVVVGDLNVLEPIHRPHYAFFRDWEYRLYDEFVVRGFVDAYRLLHDGRTEHSWVSLDNEGFRFDHAFVTHSLAERVARCEYLHETREQGLTDHSALVLELIGFGEPEELEVSDSFAGGPPALF
jgi:exonuclease III